MSPSEVVFGRKIKDLIPIVPKRLKMNPQWHDLLRLREQALAKRHMKRSVELSEHTRRLKPLTVGQSVTIQNQHGNNPKRWCNTGTIVEVGEFDKYLVKVDGSGRLTVRNRRYLRPNVTYQEALEGSHAEDLQDQPARRSERLRKKGGGGGEIRRVGIAEGIASPAFFRPWEQLTSVQTRSKSASNPTPVPR